MTEKDRELAKENRREYMKNYRSQNPERIKEIQKKYAQSEKGKEARLRYWAKRAKKT